MTVITQNHLEREGMFFDSKQEVISVKKIFKIII